MNKQIILLLTLLYATTSDYCIAQGYKKAYNCDCKLYVENININFIWTGACKDDLLHGEGSLKVCDAYGNILRNYFTGSFWYGKRSGYGSLFYTNGNIAQIGYYSNDMLNGKSTVNYPNGDKYIGIFENNLRSGYGEYFFNNGAVFKGNYSADKRNGYGKEVSYNGVTFEGYFENDKFIKNANGIFDYIESSQYADKPLMSLKNAYWQYYIPANTWGVFTLKNKLKDSNLDIYIYSDESMSTIIGTGLAIGATNELVTVPVKSYGRFVFVKIKNTGNLSTQYIFYPRYIDFVKKGEEALIETGAQYLIEQGLKWLFGVTETDENYKTNDKLVGRASAVIISTLKGNNLGSNSKSFFIKKLSNALREEFGNSFMGNLFINYGNGIYEEAFKYSD
jgi:hypothetical protein